MLSEEEKKAIERIEDTFYQDLGKGINKFQKITLYEDDIADIRKLLNLVDKQQKEIEREKQYSDFYKDLCNKQQKLINQLLEDMKERANNFSYESEIMWRKIEKAEKLLEER